MSKSKSSSPIPKFHSPDINSVLSQLGGYFESYQENLNAISEDIRNIESYLDSKNIAIYYQVNLPVDVNSDFSYALAWGKADKESKQFRLILNCYAGSEEDGFSLFSSRPLIEESVPTRLQIYPHVAEFVKQFATYLSRSSVRDLQRQSREMEEKAIREIEEAAIAQHQEEMAEEAILMDRVLYSRE